MTRTLLFLLALAMLQACPCTADAAPVVVTRSQAREYLLTKGLAADKAIQEELYQDALTEIHEHTLLALAWESLGRRLGPDLLDQLALAHQEIAIRLCRERRMRVAPVTPTDLEDYELLSRGVYFTSHILVANKAEADKLVARIKQGESFANLARSHSKDPGSAAQGGSLGAVLTGQTVMEFENALLALRPEQLSHPVESPFGWHIIRLDSLKQRDIEFSPSERMMQHETLHSFARRRAEMDLQHQVWKAHDVKLMSDKAGGKGVPAAAVVVQTRDTTLTRGQLDAMITRAFGGTGGLVAEGMGADFLRYWVDQDVWLRESKRDGTYLSPEVLDLVDLRERLLKSALFVNEHLAATITASEDDLWNYLSTHPQEFLAERSFGLWTFEFATKEKAVAARTLARKEKLDPELLSRRLKLKLQPRELSADEVRALPAHLRSALIDLDPLEWSDVLDNGKSGKAQRWLFYSLIQRRMPDLDESASLRKQVTEKVRTAMISAEISRMVNEMKRRTGLTEVQWAK